MNSNDSAQRFPQPLRGSLAALAADTEKRMRLETVEGDPILDLTDRYIYLVSEGEPEDES